MANEKVEELRKQLTLLNEAVKDINDSGMKEKTVLVLLAHYTKLPQKTIIIVLNAIENLEEEYFGIEE